MLLVLPFEAPAEDQLLPAPYQIEGLVEPRADRYGGDALGYDKPLIAVDLGHADGHPHPGSENFREMTVIGTEGVATATLYDIEKHCEYLCGDEGGTCHYVALFTLDGSEQSLGAALTALPGRPAVTDYRRLDPEGEAPDRAAALVLDRFSAPVWSPHARERPQYRITAWDRAKGSLGLQSRYRDGKPHETIDRDCELRGYGALTGLTCNSLALLLANGKPLVVSFPDYNSRVAEVIARFDHAGSTYHLVRLGLKAQTVFGFLVETETGWHGLFRPRDYDLLC